MSKAPVPDAVRLVPEFQDYRRSQIAHLRPYTEGEILSDRVSISAADKEAGSPKAGDMIARNPANHEDQWLVAADYFAANFEAAAPAPATARGGDALTKAALRDADCVSGRISAGGYRANLSDVECLRNHVRKLAAALSSQPQATGGAVDLEAIAKDAAERVHKNGGCVPQLAFAPILFALQDALATQPAPSPGDEVGCAEPQVGRAVYERIETLMDATAGTPEGEELAYLSDLVESVEEVGGYDGPLPAAPSIQKGDEG